MRYEVVKPFGLDTTGAGLKSEPVERGEIVEIPAALERGLKDEGYIKRPGDPDPTPADVERREMKVVPGADQTKDAGSAALVERLEQTILAYREAASAISAVFGLNGPEEGEIADLVLQGNLGAVHTWLPANPAAVLLFAADSAEWTAFQAQAKEILGEDTPKSKADIIEALKAEVQAHLPSKDAA